MGIITESDIFEIFSRDSGSHQEGGTRLTLELLRDRVLREVTGVIRKYEVNILSLATFYQQQKSDYCYVVMISYLGTRKKSLES